MLLACWSVKGGSGTTVVAAALALTLARRVPGGVVLADLAGDVPAALGVDGSAAVATPGISDWLAAGPSVPLDALRRLELDVGHGVRVLPAGEAPFPAADASDISRLVAALFDGAPPGVEGAATVVVDAGRPDPGSAAAALVGAATSSLLVVRPCYLALRRAVASASRPHGVVLVDEPSRALAAGDVEDALGVPVVAVVPTRPEIARAVDAGMLGGRLPRALAAALRRVA